MVGENGQCPVRLGVRPVHVLDEVAAEVPILKPGRVAGFLQHPRDPGRPRPVGLVEAHEEIALAVRGVGHGCRRRLVGMIVLPNHLVPSGW